MPPDDDRNGTETEDVRTGASEAASLIGHLKHATAHAPPPSNQLPQVPDYKLECEVGRGGMGIIYKARHLPLNRFVALKMVLTAEYVSAAEVIRFRTEAESVAAVKHPNVVQVYDLSPHGCERPYFAMEYIEGGSLAKFLKANGPLSPRATAKLLAQVADGLQAAHDAGIVHRDVKPANVLLHVKSRKVENGGSEPHDGATLRLEDVTPKVSDFGLAKRLASDATRTMAPAGTPAYMAPEQAGGKSKYIGPGADVYALGAVLYECLTGKPPFDGEDQWAIVQRVLNASPVSPRALVPTLPRDLELICLKCLEKEPHHRYHSAAALADDLRRFLEGKPVAVRPIGPVSRAARWAKRHPAPAALVTLIALLIFAVPALVVWNLGQIDKHATETSAAKDRVAAAREEERLARIAEEQQRLARIEADKAKLESDKAAVAALRLANVRDLFAIQNQLRSRAADRPLSWTYTNRAELPKAVMLAAGEPEAMGELRSAAALALLRADLKPLDPIVKGFSASAAATNPKTGMIAIGQYLRWAPITAYVRIIDPANGQVVRDLTFPAGWVRGPAGIDLTIPDCVCSLAFSADGSRLFVGTRSSQIFRFDLDKPGNEYALTWRASTRALEQLEVSPDGKTLYGLCRPEKPVFAWATDTGKLITKLEPSTGAAFTSFTVLATGDVVACDAHQICRWDSNHKVVQTVPNSGAGRLAATSTDALLVGTGRNFEVYDRDTLTSLERFVTSALRRGIHEDYVRTIVVHPSGAFVATASGDTDRTVRVWELASHRLVGTVSVTGTGPIAVAWSGDGKTLFATANNQLERWGFRSADAQRFACASAYPITTTTFIPGNRVAALTESAGPRRELLVGPAGGATVPVNLPARPEQAGITACPSAALAVGPTVPCLVTWEPRNSVAPAMFTNEITKYPRFAPDGRALWAIVSSSDVYAFDPITKKAHGSWSNKGEAVTRGLASLEALAVGRTIAVMGGRSGSIHLLDAGTVQFTTSFTVSNDPVLSLALAPDESLIVAGTQNGKLRVIRVADREEVPAVMAHPGGTTAVALSRDGKLLATGGRDRTVRFWKRAGDRFEPLFAVSDLSGPVRELQFNPDDDQLLVFVAYERAVRVWNVDRLKTQLGRFKLAW